MHVAQHQEMPGVTISYFQRGPLRLETIDESQLGGKRLEAEANGETERAEAIEVIIIHNTYSTDRDEEQEAAIAKARVPFRVRIDRFAAAAARVRAMR